ncbi:MAG: hypothetical protein UW81_C0003G0039, partial [Candidatus Giovannonibacteria bacterium GW2011_GWC2_44_9]
GGGQALTPPSRRRLGGPLPRQLADSPQASPRAKLIDLVAVKATLSGISSPFGELCPSLG